MGLLEWLFGKKNPSDARSGTGPANPNKATTRKPPEGQNVAIVKDRDGGVCGLWVRQAQAAKDRDLLSMLTISMKLPDQLGMAILAGNYRVVPNRHDDAGGCFVMFGEAIAPGEEPGAKSRGDCCRKCGKNLKELSAGVFSGDALRSMLDTSPYPCKACGAVFCVECMRQIKNDPCPECKKSLGW